MEIFDNMDFFLKGFWFVAIPTTVIFLIQTVMTFIGANASDGLEADFDGDFDGGDAPFQVFSVRNLINFLLGFSWTGITFYHLIDSKILLTFVAIAVGCLFVYLFFLVIRVLMRLAEDNSFKISETIGKIAEVYIPIPERKSGRGKVTLSVRGTLRELDAMTEGERIASNSVVKILREENGILVVEKA
ncbi:serine protease [Capnocytophaga stomatis]|uniref:Serine protease n=1 Tax=Capnocytophaga stomatis TaxID=1848904 RepID=A0A250FYG9_9FLAO|nr:NfeD family protein [Capnocytophaga stomatis]ATA90209.1 serine protease [Capnocytophaga stomatis]